MSLGIVVQIGFYKTCAYHYLGFRNWKMRMQDGHRLNGIAVERLNLEN